MKYALLLSFLVLCSCGSKSTVSDPETDHLNYFHRENVLLISDLYLNIKTASNRLSSHVNSIRLDTSYYSTLDELAMQKIISAKEGVYSIIPDFEMLNEELTKVSSSMSKSASLLETLSSNGLNQSNSAKGSPNIKQIATDINHQSRVLAEIKNLVGISQDKIDTAVSYYKSKRDELIR